MQPDELENLLRHLDDDCKRAQEKYEDIRRMLIKHFAWNNCYPAEDYADTVLDRVAARLMKENIQDINTLIQDVAKHVQREFLRWPQPTRIEDLPPAGNPQSGNKDDLQANEFETLLRRLDDDRERAGEKYEDIRRMLMKYFAWNKCYPAEDYADTVIDRVAVKLREINIQNINAFIWGVAKNVKRESYRRRQAAFIEDVPPGRNPQSIDPEREIIDRNEEQRRQCCLQKCVQDLPDSDREIFIEYEHYAARAHAVDQLAARMGLSVPALRTKAHRIRNRIEECVLSCFNGLKTRHAT